MDSQEKYDGKKLFSANLSTLMDKLGLKQVDLARKSGILVTKINDYIRGKATPSATTAIDLAVALGVTVEELFRDPLSANSSYKIELSEKIVPILDVSISAGSGLETYSEAIVGYMPIYDEILVQMGRTTTEGLCVVQCKGDSMEPKISDRSWVIIDLNDTELREGVFAFRLGDSLRIKRLRRIGLNGVEAISENLAYAPEKFEGEILNHFKIIGRAKSAITTL